MITPPREQDKVLATYIFEFIRRRNGDELHDAISTISLRSYEDLIEELSMILMHGGHPPNWVE